MALVPPVVGSVLAASMSGVGILGISSAQLSAAVSVGFCSYMLSAPVVTTTSVGSLGAGVGTGVGLTVLPSSLASAMRSTFTAAGIKGPNREQIITALSVGLCQSLLAAQLLTAHAGTGVGTGVVVSVAPVPVVSVPTMTAAFVGAGLVGPAAAGLASAIALAVDQVLPQAKGQVVIAGPPSPFGGGGPGVGRII